MEQNRSAAPDSLYDVIVLGGGPAGLTAALYLARAKYRVLVLEQEQFGGQITITHEVVNYPGVGKTSGKELTQTMLRQAEVFGAEFLLARAERLELGSPCHTVHTDKGSFQAFGLLLATGAHPRKIGFPGEEAFQGRGVAYCATCDGEFFTGKEVFVVGGGYAAAEEGVFLTKFARHVTILIRGDDFSCAAAVAQQAREHPNITVLTHTEVEEVSGEQFVTTIRYHNTQTGEHTVYESKNGEQIGVFVFAGYSPATELVRGLVELNEQGYVLTDSSQKTSVEGLYAAGDLCVKPLRQVVTATGDGALAATELEKYAAAKQRESGLHPKPPVAQASSSPSADTEDLSPDAVFTPEMNQQLTAVFERMAQPLVLKLELDSRPISRELKDYMTHLAGLTPHLRLEVLSTDAPSEEAPCVRVFRTDGTDTGLAFHGVPGGHEFTSFILGLYNAAGPGQPMEETTRQAIRALPPAKMSLLVTLSCTLCPDLVSAAQRIAAEHPEIRAEVYDLKHFEHWKQTHQVLSVPCLVLNGEKVFFGAKTLPQLLELLQKEA